MNNSKIKAIKAIVKEGMAEEGRILTKRAFRAAKRRYTMMNKKTTSGSRETLTYCFNVLKHLYGTRGN